MTLTGLLALVPSLNLVIALPSGAAHRFSAAILPGLLRPRPRRPRPLRQREMHQRWQRCCCQSRPGEPCCELHAAPRGAVGATAASRARSLLPQSHALAACSLARHCRQQGRQLLNRHLLTLRPCRRNWRTQRRPVQSIEPCCTLHPPRACHCLTRQRCERAFEPLIYSPQYRQETLLPELLSLNGHQSPCQPQTQGQSRSTHP